MQLFDMLLLAVIVMTAYLGPVVLRRLGPGQRLYGWMLVGDLVLAIVALASRRSEGPNAAGNLFGTVAVGAAACLILLPPVLRNLARRALVADRLALARRLVDLRELLQPGMGARQESELISTILEVRSGNVDAAVERLRERRDGIQEPLARRPIDERIVMTYLYARRWNDAVGWFEANVGVDGCTPQLAVELVRAYCEMGALERAAGLVERLELVHVAEEPMWLLLVSRARLVFLAFVGRIAAVEAILGAGGPLGAMPETAREYWAGLVRLKAGDLPGARASLERAAALSGRDGRAREVAEATLRRINEPGVAGPLEVPPMVAELAERLSRLAEDAPSGPSVTGSADMNVAPKATPARLPSSARAKRQARQVRLERVSWREVPVTTATILINLVAAGAVYAVFGSFTDLGALVLAGANVKSATAAGEAWRLVSSMFLHVGVIHLALNMYGLWILGRLVEQFLGPARTFAVLMAAGVVGSGASLLFGGPATSAGASGAVFGLLGAAAVELALHRKAYPRRWRGLLLGNLVFLAVASVVIGLLYPIIDQSAHLGGLATGVLLGALLSRKLRVASASWMRVVVAALCVAGGGALAYGAIGAAQSDFAGTMARFPRQKRVVGGLEVRAPAPWEKVSDTELLDPHLIVMVQLGRASSPGGDLDLDSALERRRELERTEGVRQHGFDRARQVASARLRVPEPWQIRELEATLDIGVGGEQVYRIAVIGRADGGELWLGSIYYPPTLAGHIAPTITELLNSAHAP